MARTALDPATFGTAVAEAYATRGVTREVARGMFGMLKRGR
jgi:hypothetical protein